MKSTLADHILLSLKAALKYARGGEAGVFVHRVVPSATAAHEARIELGLPVRAEDVIRSRRGSKHGWIA